MPAASPPPSPLDAARPSTPAARWIDIGVNLTDRRFDADRDAVLARAFAAGVEHIVVTGTDIEHSRAAVAACKETPGRLSCCVGVHPHTAAAAAPDFIDTLRELATSAVVGAIGETGLDYDRDFSPRPVQRAVFAAQLELAAALRLPVFVHDRASAGDVARIIAEHRNNLVDVVVHCFTGSESELRALVELDCHIGVTGWVCDERRGTELARLVPLIPERRLLLETDAPWLVPRTLRPRPQRNEPALLPEIGRVVAGLRGCSVASLAASTSANARRFFRLDTGG